MGKPLESKEVKLYSFQSSRDVTTTLQLTDLLESTQSDGGDEAKIGAQLVDERLVGADVTETQQRLKHVNGI